MWTLWESQATKDRKKAEEENARREREAKVVEHNTRNFNKGGAMVLTSTVAAIVAASFCRKSVIARRYVPKQFDSNVLPPKFNPMQDAMRAVGDATLLATSFFAFTVSTLFWTYDAGSFKELGSILTAKYSPDRDIPSDPESERVEKELTQLLFSKPSKKPESS